MSDCKEIHERVQALEIGKAKLEVRVDNHEQIIMKLDTDIQSLRQELGGKIDNALIKAMDTVPPWFAKFVVGLSISIVMGMFSLHYFHVI